VIYFTADLHFGHKNIIDFCKRPFVDVVEMREKMLNAINATVRDKDEFYILGDFGLHLRTEDVKELRKRIICKNITLILGNHDSHQHGQAFEHCYLAHVVKWNHQRFYLSHYPLRSWREHFQLHGHEHGTMPPLVGQLDVGVDGQRGGFRKEPFGTPWSVEEVIEYVQRRDKDRVVKDACQERHEHRLIVGGYGGRNKLDQPIFSTVSKDDGGDAS